MPLVSPTLDAAMVLLAAPLTSVYVKMVVAPNVPGLGRLIACLPALIFNCMAPCFFDNHSEVLARVTVIFVFSWLANFKLLGFCMNRGPLAGPDWTTAQMIAILCMPIYPCPPKAKDEVSSGRLHDDAGKPHELLRRLLIKAVLFSAFVYGLTTASLTPLARAYLQASALYCFIGILMDGPASIVTHFLGFSIIPTMDHPWLSTSLSDFWALRWNVTTSHLLRAIIYDPIVEGRFIKISSTKPIRSRILQNTGMCVTFLASGIIHEAIFWALQPDGRFHWKWLLFFTLQGPLLIAEYLARKYAKQNSMLPNVWVARVGAIGFLMYMGHVLFFTPCNIDTDTAERVTKACGLFIQGGLDLIPAKFAVLIMGS